MARIAAAFASGARRVLYVLPTGGGKTVVMQHVAERLAGRRVGLAAHRVELLEQATRRMPPAVRVGSVQTWANRTLALDFGLLDEAHHAVARNYRRMLDKVPLWLGVTATPERLDGQGLGDVFDTMIVGPSSADLCADGYLAPVECYAPAQPPDIRSVHVKLGDFMTRELALVMDRPTVTGDAVASYQRYAAGLPAIVFCVSVEHAKNTAAVFNSEGWSAVAVYGAMPDDERRDAIAGLATGKYTHLMSCSLIDEGLDVPGVSCIVDLAPTVSLSRWLQRIGRGRRPDRCIVLDHAGNMMLRHGWPDWPREWSLAGRPKRSRTAPAIAQCPACYAIHPPGPTCTACGHDYGRAAAEKAARELEVRAGELSAMTLEDARMAHLKHAPLRELVRGAATWDDLDAIRRARGYHAAWTNRQASFKRVRHVPATGDEFENISLDNLLPNTLHNAS